MNVVETPYPTPPLLILTDFILPLLITGVNFAPVPIPETDISGGVL